MICVLVVSALLFAGGVVLFFLPIDVTHAILIEDGPVEDLQVVLYIAGAMLSWAYAFRRRWAGGAPAGLILLIFALRELDFQKRFTTMSVTKTKFFVSPAVPIAEKLIAGAMLIAITVFLLVFVKRYAKVFITRLREGRDWASTALAGILFLPLSVLIDGAERELKSIGIVPAATVSLIIAIAEETVEFAIPLFFLLALIQWGRNSAGTSTAVKR